MTGSEPIPDFQCPKSDHSCFCIRLINEYDWSAVTIYNGHNPPLHQRVYRTLKRTVHVHVDFPKELEYFIAYTTVN